MSGRLVTLEDRRAVYALLDRMLDWLPAAALGLRRPEDGATRPGEGRWVRCSRCAGEGRVTGEGAAARACRQRHDRWPHGHGCRPCLACEYGWVKLPVAKGRPQPGSDPMLNPGRTEFATEAAERSERARWVDAQLVKLAALQAQHDGRELPDDEADRMLKRKRHLYGSGSFGRLEAALDLLAVTYPARHAAVVFFVVERQLEPNPDTRVRLDESVVWLAARMPRPILLPADAQHELAVWKISLRTGKTAEHRRQRDLRDAEIVALNRDHGWSLRRLATLYDMSPEGIRGIIASRTADPLVIASGPAA